VKRFSLAQHPIGRLAEALSPCVLDLGARADADEELLDTAWASRIFCFEADPVEANSLSQSGDARWREFKVLPFAVGGIQAAACSMCLDHRRRLRFFRITSIWSIALAIATMQIKLAGHSGFVYAAGSSGIPDGGGAACSE